MRTGFGCVLNSHAIANRMRIANENEMEMSLNQSVEYTHTCMRTSHTEHSTFCLISLKLGIHFTKTYKKQSSGVKNRVCSVKGLMLETSATHQIPQAKNIPYQPLLIKPVFSLLANEEKRFLKNTSLPVLISYIWSEIWYRKLEVRV